MDERTLGSVNLKPNKPDAFDGRRDFLAVSTWLFKVEQYLTLSAISNPSATISDESRIMFASSFMTSTAASWWYTIIQSGQEPSTWTEFRTLVLNEFVPVDHNRRARDKLRRLKQNSSVSKYLSEFRNCILTVNDMSDGERFDRFVQGLKNEVKLEVLKSQASNFEDAAKIALRIDSALWSSTAYVTEATGSRSDPMEIGNVQRRTPRYDDRRRQKEQDIKNNCCVVCHTKHCRPWKCLNKKKINALASSTDDNGDSTALDEISDSEN